MYVIGIPFTQLLGLLCLSFHSLTGSIRGSGLFVLDLSRPGA